MGYPTKRMKVRRHNHFMKLSALVALAGVKIVPLDHPNGECLNVYAIIGLRSDNQWYRTYWGKQAAVRRAARLLGEGF